MLLGFGQITIYDNQSNDASERILKPLARAGIINAKFWTDRPTKQRRAYTNAIRKLRPFVEWCLFADFDEFLILDPGLSRGDLHREREACGEAALPAIGLGKQLVDVDGGQRHAWLRRVPTFSG